MALGLGLIGLAAFMWSLKSGRFDDLEGPAWRTIPDEDEDDAPTRSRHTDPQNDPLAKTPGRR